MGQLSAKSCPLCGEPNGGRWTCQWCTTVVDIYRGLVRGLQSWRSLHEAREVGEVITDHLGRQWSLWDLERFYGYRSLLSIQQGRAIEAFLYHNLRERDAAIAMGVSPTVPVGTYATVGLTRLLAMAAAGDLPGCWLDLYIMPDVVSSDA